jgi:hypothetical protein
LILDRLMEAEAVETLFEGERDDAAIPEGAEAE